MGALAVTSVVAYLMFTVRHRERIHPGERWLVLANALAFGSAYVLGAWSVSFILVLVVHHEVQYLYFTYAMARRSASPRPGASSWPNCACSRRSRSGRPSDWRAGHSASDWRPPGWPPFLVSGLLCHYWLDGRIWTKRARLAA